jgi:CRP/FNR family transcriptional regulator, dissimilatory nitrate respiration regulator
VGELLPDAVRAAGETLKVAARRRLASQGEEPRYVFYVVAGEVRLMRAGRKGESVILQRVRRGWVAEASLFARRYHCDLQTAAATTLVRIPVATLRKELETSSGFRRYWIECLSSEVRRLRGTCERFGLRRAEERVLHAIESDGTDGELRLGEPVKDWAAELGLTHEALYRALARLERSGVLKRANGVLILESTTGGRPGRGRRQAS